MGEHTLTAHQEVLLELFEVFDSLCRGCPRSYEHYLQMQREMEITEYTRSIR